MSTEQRKVSDTAPETEAELEAFRQRWREEVEARNKKTTTPSTKKAYEKIQRQRGAPPPAHATGVVPSSSRTYNEEIEPKAYHDLPNKEDQLVLGTEGQDHDRNVYKEPSSALEHYEKAVEKETQGNLGESMRHYRKAFKLDDGVHEAYKRKHFPPSSFVKPKPTNPNPSNAAPTVPRTDHHSLHGSSSEALPATLKQLVDDFSSLQIEAPPPPTDASPQERCLIAEMPEEILTQILADLAVSDVASFARLAQVCKRLAYLVLTEEAIWKRVAQGSEFGFGAMLYDYTVDIEGFPISASDNIARYLDADIDEAENPPLVPLPKEREQSFDALTDSLLHTTYLSSWRHLFRSRPRLRFNGCYISTVNYTRAGATATNTLTWGAPIHVVTYFRYLRFFRDGSAISLLTTSEPSDVVHHLTKANLHSHHGSYLPSSVMKDALRGRWRLSGPASSSSPDPLTGEEEHEGELFIETEGAVPKYTYKMHLAVANAGKSTRNNKLAWKRFWSHNKLTDDWGEFTLRNDKAFYWSRVRSYGDGW
ncbi:hypothetical protein PRZ48_011710 [Zasmidium cellare]|uniref:F-box domain-containing protein n=1 Tax=Zasmidium cellare TaxID=395010 RepID=A0ABR0E7N6_ZASCE|nr:hypothetical protein PRZ48_011710 [Zasmidium cellare]